MHGPMAGNVAGNSKQSADLLFSNSDWSRICYYAKYGAKNCKQYIIYKTKQQNQVNSYLSKTYFWKYFMICRTLRLQQGPRILGFARQQCAGIWPNSDGNLSSVVLKQKSPFSKNNNLFQHKKYYSSQDKKMPPIKVLNVAEKNDAAKNIAELLSRGRSQRVIFLKYYWRCKYIFY